MLFLRSGALGVCADLRQPGRMGSRRGSWSRQASPTQRLRSRRCFEADRRAHSATQAEAGLELHSLSDEGLEGRVTIVVADTNTVPFFVASARFPHWEDDAMRAIFAAVLSRY